MILPAKLAGTWRLSIVDPVSDRLKGPQKREHRLQIVIRILPK